MRVSSTLALGIMSGTSLDGLDLALCRFRKFKQRWQYKLIRYSTIPYEKRLKEELARAHALNGEQLIRLHYRYAEFIAQQVNRFLKPTGMRCDVIGSHGHTVFHQPEQGMTFQLGSGAVIAALTGIDTISDFRSGDVALGGQGAPLVPVGDALLFSEYDVCLNLGGIANLSYQKGRERMAMDVCPVNMILNTLAALKGRSFDRNGRLAARGNIHKPLLQKLNRLDYYHQPAPKSLSREWFSTCFYPLIHKSSLSIEDKLATCCEHIAMQIAWQLGHVKSKTCKILVSGGGAKNRFLMERLKYHFPAQWILASEPLLKMKEAIVFAFLAVLRMHKEINCLKTVTGACRSSVQGAWYSAR